MPKPMVQAAYSVPNHEPFTASHALPLSASSSLTATEDTVASTADKIAYLAALRTAVTAVQDDVNRELTARMVLDTQATNQATADKTAQKEEENYGEEVMDEDQ